MRSLRISSVQLHALVPGLAAVLFLAALPPGVQAHREQTILTTMECNERTGLAEIIHRTFAHDVEHTLGNRLQVLGGLDNLEARARVSLEFSNSFTLWNEQGEKIPLQLVGAELDGEFFYIYQEAGCDILLGPLNVRHEMMRNYWPDMTNQLNIYYPSGTRSLVFDNNSGMQQVQPD